MHIYLTVDGGAERTNELRERLRDLQATVSSTLHHLDRLRERPRAGGARKGEHVLIR